MPTYHAPCTHDGEVDDGVSLLAETVQLGRPFDTEVPYYRPTDVDSDALTDERPEHDVVSNEDKVEVSFLVAWIVRRRRGYTVRDEEERGERVGDAFSLRNVRRGIFPGGPEEGEDEQDLQGRTWG